MPSKLETAHSAVEKAPSDYEIDVNLWQSVIGTEDISAMLVGQALYIQPADVFNFVHIRADQSLDGSKLSGFYIDESRKYSFDNTDRTVTYRDTTWHLTPDEYIVQSDGDYLRTDMFEKIFNLKAIFDFRGLSVELKSGEPLPAESEAKYAAKRKDINGSSSPEQEIPDVTIGLHRSLLSMGTLDYSGSTSYTNGPNSAQQPSQYSLLMGGQFLGGDIDANLIGQSQQRVDWRAVPWQWRYAVENSDLVRQILIGRQDPLFTTMHLADSMVGFQISNVNTAYKSSFSNYTISDHTEPDWTVELYINDALVNYTKADQTGFYKFVIPLSYGATNVKLKFYGPYGEVRTSVVELRIPYTFLPPGHLEYTLAGGTSIDHPGIQNSTGQFDMKLGVSTAMTVGAGLRYLAAPGLPTPAAYTPYGSASLRVSGGILVGGEYYQGSGYRGTVSITGPLGLSMDAEYDKPLTTMGVAGYDGLAASASDPFYILNQRKLTLNSPLPFSAGMLRMTALDLPVNTDTSNLGITAETLLNLFGTSLNLSASYYFLRDRLKLYTEGDGIGQAGLSFTVLNGMVVRPSVAMDYTTGKIQSAEVGITKSIGDWGNFSLTGTHAFTAVASVLPGSLAWLDGLQLGTGNSIQLSLRTMLPFAQVGVSSSTGSGQPVTSSTTVQGSLGFDAGTGVYGSNRPEVRRGGVEVIPFIDENDNGKWDPGEKIVPKFELEQAPGRVTTEPSGILKVMDLEPYHPYFMRTSTAGLDNISLLPKYNSFSITPPANGFARIEIPLASAGQIEGYVMSIKNGKPDGLGGARLKVQHRGKDGLIGGDQDTSDVKLTEDLLSYSNGEYYYMGLTPGNYRIYVDPAQLRILNAFSSPPYRDFTVHNVEDGDVINGLNFTIEAQPGLPASPAEALKSK